MQLPKSWASARRFRPLVTYPLLAAAISSLINDHVIELLSVSGSSMAPTLSPYFHTTGEKDYMLLLKYRPTLGMRRGDIVAFYAPHRPERLVVKRVVGLAGDEVRLDKRRGETGSVTVPPGHVWVEGDNWRGSGDSHLYGPVSRSLITGRAVKVVWPLSRWGEPWEGWTAGRRVRKAEDLERERGVVLEETGMP